MKVQSLTVILMIMQTARIRNYTPQLGSGCICKASFTDSDSTIQYYQLNFHESDCLHWVQVFINFFYDFSEK